MPKLRKQRRRKVYKHNVNRKRLRNKILSKGNIACTEIKKAWDEKKSVQANLRDMGICYNPNETLKIKSNKEKTRKAMAEATDDQTVETQMDTDKVIEDTPAKIHVLEEIIEDATAPRRKMFRLPKGQVAKLSSLLTKYGLDFKAMAKDKTNYDQETWKQIRAKVRRFQSIPEQYQKFLEAATPETLKKLDNEMDLGGD